MKGYRARFFKSNAPLESIEILTWAAGLSCFTMEEAKENFSYCASRYKNFDHEISERLRKLLKSEMIVVADDGAIDAQEKQLAAKELDPEKAPSQEEALLIRERLDIIRQVLAEMKNEKRGKGRPPRLYFTNKAAEKYVETRSIDFVHRAVALEAMGKPSDAVSLVNTISQRMISENRVEDLDRALFSVDLPSLSSMLVMALLQSTSQERRRLPSRAEFFGETMKLAAARGEPIDHFSKLLEAEGKQV